MRERLVAGGRDREDDPFTLNAAGKAIRDMLDRQSGRAQVAGTVETGYEAAEHNVVERDVLGLVAELVKRRMLVAT